MTLLESPGSFSRDASSVLRPPPRRFLSPADSIFARSGRDPAGDPLNELHDDHFQYFLAYPNILRE